MTDRLRFFGGCLVALPLAAAFWAVVGWVVTR
jgi:hypothetical protein